MVPPFISNNPANPYPGIIVSALIDVLIILVIIWVLDTAVARRPFRPKVLRVVLAAVAVASLVGSWYIEFRIVRGPQFSNLSIPAIGGSILELQPADLRPSLIEPPLIAYESGRDLASILVLIQAGSHGGDLMVLLEDIDPSTPCAVLAVGTSGAARVGRLELSVDKSQSFDEGTIPAAIDEDIHRTVYPIPLHIMANTALAMTCSTRQLPAFESYSRKAVWYIMTFTPVAENRFPGWTTIFPEAAALNHEEPSKDDSLIGGQQIERRVEGKNYNAVTVDGTNPFVRAAWTDIERDENRSAYDFASGVLAALGSAATLSFLIELLRTSSA